MIKGIIKNYFFIRALRALLALFITITLMFFIIRLMPGNPIDVYINTLISTMGLSYEEAKIMALSLFSINLDEPLYLQYFGFIRNLFMGDLGKSISVSIGMPVIRIIAEFLPWTVFTVATGILISFTLGILIGMLMAYRRGGIVDSILTIIFSIINSIPNFIIGILLIVFLGVQWGIVPFTMLRGAYSPYVKPGFTWEFISDVLLHAFFPILTYVLTTIGGWALSMKSISVSVLGEDYILVARARGLHERRIMTRYVGRNAILPAFTNLAITLGYVFGGSVLIESVFVYRGIGLKLIEAINARDYTVMQGIFLIVALAVILSNYIADIIYGVLDPRVRVGE